MSRWLHLHHGIRSITSTRWDDATWLTAKLVLRKALAARLAMARGPWRN